MIALFSADIWEFCWFGLWSASNCNEKVWWYKLVILVVWMVWYCCCLLGCNSSLSSEVLDLILDMTFRHDYFLYCWQDPVGSHQTTTTNLLGEATVCMNEPKERFSFWNIGRFERRNTGSSVSPTITLASNANVKRSAKFDESIPPKYRKLGNKD